MRKKFITQSIVREIIRLPIDLLINLAFPKAHLLLITIVVCIITELILCTLRKLKRWAFRKLTK